MNKIITLLLACSLSFSTPAEAATDPVEQAAYAEAINALEQLIAQQTTSPSIAGKIRLTVMTMEDQAARHRENLKKLIPGTGSYIALREVILNQEARAAAIRRGLAMADAAGYQYMAIISTRLISINGLLMPTQALLDQLIYGPGYMPSYDSAEWNPTGPAGDIGSSDQTWLVGLFDGGIRGSKSSKSDDVEWAPWSEEDPESDNPGPVALGGEDAPSITAQSEGPVGPWMLSVGMDPYMVATRYRLGQLSEQFDTPLAYGVTVNGVEILTVVHGADYAESFDMNGSRVDWHML